MDGSGTIDEDELKTVLRLMGEQMTDDQAHELFLHVDADKSGALEQGEIEKLAQWVFGQFHPDGEQMSPQQQDSQMAKLMELDVNHDGKIDFGEFGDWFNETAKSIYQYQHEQGWLAREKRCAPRGGPSRPRAWHGSIRERGLLKSIDRGLCGPSVSR